MNKSSNSGGGSIGFSGLLTIVFIVLKLTGVVEWNWLWVLAPMWISLIILVMCAIVIVLASK